MSCLRLHVRHLTETSGEFLVPGLGQYLSSHHKVLLSHQSHYQTNLQHRKLWKSGTHCDGGKPSFIVHGARDSQTADRHLTKQFVSSSLCKELKSCHHHHLVAVRHSHHCTATSLSCACRSASAHHLCGCSALIRGHSLTALILRQSSRTFPLLTLNLSSSSSLGFKDTVRFYRGQTRRIVNRNQDSSKNLIDETDGESGDEGVVSRTLSHVIPGHIKDRECDTKLETVDTSDSTRKDTEQDIAVRHKPADEMTLPELSRVSFSIVPYVSRSVTLQNLVRLGVNLDRVQRVAGVAEHLIKCDFDRHVVPLLKFLALVGVKADKVGYIFTANPLLFMESVQDLELRIGYLLHKNFSLREIASIMTCAPICLLMDPVMLDGKLGFLQNVFNLTDHEVREVVKLYPKILPRKKELLAEVKFHVMEFMGFNNSQIKQLVIKDPKIFASGKGSLVARFDYLYNYMMLSHEHILTWPKILRMRTYIVKNRHLFLLSLDRAQYDPYKENYISLQALALGSDEEFCQNVAKSSLQDFFNFCKTL